MRSIDADELMELYDGCDGLSVPIAVVRQNIEDAPTIDAEPVRHGHWIKMFESYACSECYCPADKESLSDYCPDCGAKMDEVSE